MTLSPSWSHLFSWRATSRPVGLLGCSAKRSIFYTWHLRWKHILGANASVYLFSSCCKLPFQDSFDLPFSLTLLVYCMLLSSLCWQHNMVGYCLEQEESQCRQSFSPMKSPLITAHDIHLRHFNHVRVALLTCYTWSRCTWYSKKSLELCQKINKQVNTNTAREAIT